MAKMLKLFCAKFPYNLVFLIYGCFMTVKQPRIRFICPSASIFHLCVCWNVFAICCTYLLSLLCIWWSAFAILQRLFGWDSAVWVQAQSVILTIVGFPVWPPGKLLQEGVRLPQVVCSRQMVHTAAGCFTLLQLSIKWLSLTTQHLSSYPAILSFPWKLLRKSEESPLCGIQRDRRIIANGRQTHTTEQYFPSANTSEWKCNQA